ncbi:hypothetical protein BDQ12DRAFT_750546 [Crucibulum laeve]|uniref:Uncharacterized protein n=1 Tax=Crucibulum laeve TaxID=68775 RepID=A0A5C3LWT4_9AGAR|nr:hypothetical protein BDQ12DRAFT_750546 [Crucibulum laeve]
MAEFTNPHIQDFLISLSILADAASVVVVASFAVTMKQLTSLRAEQRNIPTTPNGFDDHRPIRVVRVSASAYAVIKIISASVKLAFTSKSFGTFNLGEIILYSVALIMIQLAPRRIKREFERQKQPNTASLPLHTVSNAPAVDPPTTLEEKL